MGRPGQWLFMVPLKGGRWHIIPNRQYIPLIYCLLGAYMLPTTFYGNQKQVIDLGKPIMMGQALNSAQLWSLTPWIQAFALCSLPNSRVKYTVFIQVHTYKLAKQIWKKTVNWSSSAVHPTIYVRFYTSQVVSWISEPSTVSDKPVNNMTPLPTRAEITVNCKVGWLQSKLQSADIGLDSCNHSST